MAVSPPRAYLSTVVSTHGPVSSTPCFILKMCPLNRGLRVSPRSHAACAGVGSLIHELCDEKSQAAISMCLHAGRWFLDVMPRA